MRELVFFDDEQRQTVEELWQEGLPRADIAEAVGLRTRQLETLKAKGMINVPKRQGKCGGIKGRPPSPNEIRAACREVQSKWTPQEEALRRAGSGTVASPSALKEEGLRYGRMMYETTKPHPLKGRTT